jgi:hypothetical protein
MPYIPKFRREDILIDGTTNGPGELNFLITSLCVEYIEQHGLSYQTVNDIVGALEGAKLEFYARVARPYEDRKIKENGDVYGSV